jgi:hypothetical protein
MLTGLVAACGEKQPRIPMSGGEIKQKTICRKLVGKPTHRNFSRLKNYNTKMGNNQLFYYHTPVILGYFQSFWISAVADIFRFHP